MLFQDMISDFSLDERLKVTERTLERRHLNPALTTTTTLQ